MTPEYLNDDQRLLYECLKTIWLEQGRKIVLTVLMALMILFGIIVGVLSGTRQSLRQTAEISQGLHTQMETNRSMIGQMVQESRLQQQRYQNLIAAFEMVRRHGARDEGRAQTDHNRAVKNRR